MGNDELTTYQLAGREPKLSISISVTHFYGVRVPDDTAWLALEEDPGQCRNNGDTNVYGGQIGYLQAGAYDQDMTFLAINWKHIEPGEYVFHSGEYPNANKFERDRWNDDLRAEADRLGLEIVEGPGWFTLPDEG